MEEIKTLEVICMGDIAHNEIVNILYNDVDRSNECYKKIAPVIFNFWKIKNSWCFRSFSKSDAKSLNAMMKSTNKFEERVLRFLHKKLNNSHYYYMFHKELIDGLSNQLIKEIK